MSTTIEWTDETWNPVRGCALVSPGCENCYAMKQAHRFSGLGRAYAGLTVLGKHGPRWNGHARFVPEMLDAPLKWKKPRRIFVNSMSDLFHDDITNEQIAAVFGVMAACPQHTFQVLTKRIDRALSWFDWLSEERNPNGSWPLTGDVLHRYASKYTTRSIPKLKESQCWMPLSNVWIGVSAEDQQRADERIPLLLQTPAAIRFISAEPLLSQVELDPDWLLPRCKACGRHSARGKCCEYELDCTGDTKHSVQSQPALLDWVIVGGESWVRARPCDPRWIFSVVALCRSAGVSCFVKQLGARVQIDGRDVRYDHVLDSWVDGRLFDRKGGDPIEWPEEWRVQEFPR